MTVPIEAVRELAAVAPVFPVYTATNGACSCGNADCGSVAKHPRTRHGLKDASRDGRQIEEWWATRSNVGLITGAAAGFFVLDVDAKHGGPETLAAFEHEHGSLPATWQTATGGGGAHYYFRHPGHYVTGCVGKIGLGLDVRGDGNYVVAPPSIHASGVAYAWAPGRAPREVELASAPEWLLEMLRPRTEERRERSVGTMNGNGAREHPYALAALKSACDAVGTASEGERNVTLNKEAFGIAQLVAGGVLDRGNAKVTLQSAAESAGLPEREVTKTLQSAFGGGERKPRGVPPPRSERTGYAPPEAGKPLFLPVGDFFASCNDRVEYILEPYLPKGAFLLVNGAPKGGKTWFMAWLAGKIAEAGNTVMFIEEEGSKETLRTRLEPFTLPGARIHVSHRNAWRLDDDRSVARLIEEIKAAGANVVILDPLIQLHSHERKIGEVPAEVIQNIQRIIKECGCSIIVAHHTRKGDSWNKEADGEAQSADAAGSFAWTASADNIIQIKGVPNRDRRPGEVRFYVENSDTRNGEPFRRRLAIVRPGPYRPGAMTMEVPDSKEMLALRELMPLIPGEAAHAISVDALRRESGKGKSVVQSGVDLGIGLGWIVRRLKGGGIYRAKNDGLASQSPVQSDTIGPSDSPLIGEYDVGPVPSGDGN